MPLYQSGKIRIPFFAASKASMGDEAGQVLVLDAGNRNVKVQF